MAISGLSFQSSALLFLKTAFGVNPNTQKDKAEAPNPIIKAIEESDPAKAQDLKDQLAQTKQTIQQLESSKTNLNDQRKEAARQKIEQLKAQIKALRFLAAGDPKTAARQAARIARELASAAREYASAGGGADTSGVLDAPAANLTAPSATQPEAPPPAPTETAAATATPETSEAAPQTATAQNDAEQVASENKEEEFKEKLAGANAKIGASQEDAEFVKTVRRLLEELKSILKAAKNKIGPNGDQDTFSAENDIQDTEKSLNVITSNALAVTVSVSIDIKA